MTDYIVTAKAGRRISGIPTPGAGGTIALTDAQAAHELRMGAIVRADDPGDRKRAAKKQPTKAERAHAKAEKARRGAAQQTGAPGEDGAPGSEVGGAGGAGAASGAEG